MQLPHPLLPATFERRLNRFAAQVRLNGRSIQAHVANSGRLKELFAPGACVYLAARPGVSRKTQYDLELVDRDGVLVSADARLSSTLVFEAFQSGMLPQFAVFSQAQREVQFRDSRLDLRFGGSRADCFVEVKSITLVRNSVALFPDAPTERGRRHVEALRLARKSGHRAAAIFVIQRPDAMAFAPNDETDPAFGDALRRAARAGVEVYAYRCSVTLERIELLGTVPVLRRQPQHARESRAD
jgi:sugar fermentation stimulation protein A